MKMLKYITILVFLYSGGINAQFPVPNDNIFTQPQVDSTPYRLPEIVQPISYHVVLEPFLADATFNGSVEIKAKAIVDWDNITMHIFSISNMEITVKEEDSPIDIFNDLELVDEFQFLTLKLKEKLVIGSNYIINIKYTGILHNDNSGFYRAEYVNENGDTRYLGTTQFESTGARRAFPCFDEPALKAKFTIEIIRDPDYMSIANMPLEKTVDEGQKKRDTFKETVEMSTYLVAFVVSDFTHSFDGVRQGIIATSANIKAGYERYALNVSERILAWLESYTDEPFQIEKMDQAAIPNDYFAAGAMENWGLVTYKEKYLLHMDGLSTSMDQQNIATIVAHEFGHQWFGDLVSPLWWKYIWLNEGFATYFEYHAAAEVHKDWRLREQYVVDTVQNALNVDGVINTRPMTYDAGSPSEISRLFDRIAYDKSGSVIRMWEHILTPNVFQAGLQNYLKNMSYKAAQADDLYSGFQNALDDSNINYLPDGKDVKTVFGSWENTPGYPLLSVIIDLNMKLVNCTQKRYVGDNVSDNSTFHIPINMATSMSPNFASTAPDIWLTEKTDSLPLPDEFTAEDWIILNKQATGYYRIKYDENNYRNLESFLKTSENIQNIHSLNRAQLIHDALTLAKDGHLDFNIALGLSMYLKNEDDYIPLAAFVNSITPLTRLFAHSAHNSMMKDYIITVLSNAVNKLTMDETDTDPHVTKLNRVKILTIYCKHNAECQQTSLTKFNNWMADQTKSIPPNLEGIVYCGAISAGDETQWNFLYEKYQEVPLETTRSRIISSLGCSEHVDLLEGFMNKSLLGAPIKQIDRLAVFTAVLNGGNHGIDVVLDYVHKNFESIDEKLGKPALGSILSNVGALATQKAHEDKIKAIQEQYPGNDAIFAGALNNIATNIKWMEKHESGIGGWLANNFPEKSFAVANNLSFSILCISLLATLFKSMN